MTATGNEAVSLSQLLTYANSLQTQLDDLQSLISSLSTTVDGKQDVLTLPLSIANGGTGNTTGLAASATQLATARTFRTNLASTSTASFNGTANVTPGVTGTLALTNGGTGATTAANARSNLSVYSQSEVDSLITDNATRPYAYKYDWGSGTSYGTLALTAGAMTIIPWNTGSGYPSLITTYNDYITGNGDGGITFSAAGIVLVTSSIYYDDSSSGTNYYGNYIFLNNTSNSRNQRAASYMLSGSGVPAVTIIPVTSSTVLYHCARCSNSNAVVDLDNQATNLCLAYLSLT